MQSISNKTRSLGASLSSRQDGDIGAAFTNNKYFSHFDKNLIQQANSVPILHIFRHYGLNISEINNKIICPFLFHKGGKENNPSFNYYPNTNSFWCFGCKSGRKSCDFVAAIDNISKTQAAQKVLLLFEEEVDYDNLENCQSFSERMEIMMRFAEMLYQFRVQYSSNLDRFNQLCQVYDTINHKHVLDNEALNFLVDELKKEMLDIE